MKNERNCDLSQGEALFFILTKSVRQMYKEYYIFDDLPETLNY